MDFRLKCTRAFCQVRQLCWHARRCRTPQQARSLNWHTREEYATFVMNIDWVVYL